MECNTCDKELTGKQTKFCCIKCKNQNSNHKHNDYKAQKLRRFNRKRRFVLLKGGSCEKCGYDKNLTSLSFHHRDPSKKDFSLSARELGMYKEDRLLIEVNKCDLLCANCHMEEHASAEMLNWKGK